MLSSETADARASSRSDEEPIAHWAIAPPVVAPQRSAEIAITAGLVRPDSGIEHIYTALDALTQRFALSDAAIVVDEPNIGRQIFRAGRRPIANGASPLLDSEPGLYTNPAMPLGTFDSEWFLNACQLALHLEMLRYDAWHDALTGLFDRRSFEHLLEMSVARSQRYDWAFTLVLIDVDQFKTLNDRLGHAAGDRSLQALAERFQSVLRVGDIAARIGGDEFGLILPNVEPREIPELLLRIAKSPSTQAPCPPFSYGWACCPTDASDANALFEVADHALYAHKAGREQEEQR